MNRRAYSFFPGSCRRKCPFSILHRFIVSESYTSRDYQNAERLARCWYVGFRSIVAAPFVAYAHAHGALAGRYSRWRLVDHAQGGHINWHQQDNHASDYWWGHYYALDCGAALHLNTGVRWPLSQIPQVLLTNMAEERTCYFFDI